MSEEVLQDEELSDESELVAFALVYLPLYNKEVVWFRRETEKESCLHWLSAGGKLGKNRVFHPIYAILVL